MQLSRPEKWIYSPAAAAELLGVFDDSTETFINLPPNKDLFSAEVAGRVDKLCSHSTN